MEILQPAKCRAQISSGVSADRLGIAHAMNQARQALLAGNSGVARSLCESILKQTPKNSEALHLLGVIEIQNGAFADAVSLIRKSLKANPLQSEAQSNLAHCYNALGKAIDAKKHAEVSIRLDPLNPRPYINKGLAHLAAREFTDAEKCFLRALELDSENVEATYNLGLLYFETQNFPAAKAQFQKAAELEPNSPEIYHNLALTLEKSSEPAAAEICIQKAISLKPDNIQLQISHAALLTKRGENELALKILKETLAAHPGNSKAFYNTARAYRNLGKLSEAADCCRNAYTLDPGNHKALFNESIFRLTLGDFPAGWSAYKARWNISLYGKPPRIKRQQWKGESLKGALMIWGEQGLGDEILHFSLLREVQERVVRVIVYTDQRLIPLLTRSFPRIEFRERAASIAEKDFEKWICSGDLGGILRTSWASFEHQPSPYLITDQAFTQTIRERLITGKKIICGLSWTSKSKEHEFRKSLRIIDLVPILKIPGLEFVDVSYVDSESDRERALRSSGTHLNRIQEIDHFNDIDKWASVIDSCDCVVTVSNTTAHLAGALGKKTIVLLPYAEGSLWYWHQGQAQSVWYPTVKLLRQQRPGEWHAPIEESTQLLTQLFNEPN